MYSWTGMPDPSSPSFRVPFILLCVASAARDGSRVEARSVPTGGLGRSQRHLRPCRSRLPERLAEAAIFREAEGLVCSSRQERETARRIRQRPARRDPPGSRIALERDPIARSGLKGSRSSLRRSSGGRVDLRDVAADKGACAKPASPWRGGPDRACEDPHITDVARA